MKLGLTTFKLALCSLTILSLLTFPASAQPGDTLEVGRRSAGAPQSFSDVGPNNSDWMVAHFINVGQGPAVLLEFSCGLALIDTATGQSAHIDWERRFSDYLDRVFNCRPDLNRTTYDLANAA